MTEEVCSGCGKRMTKTDIENSPLLGAGNWMCQTCGEDFLITSMDAVKSFFSFEAGRVERIIRGQARGANLGKFLQGMLPMLGDRNMNMVFQGRELNQHEVEFLHKETICRFKYEGLPWLVIFPDDILHKAIEAMKEAVARWGEESIAKALGGYLSLLNEIVEGSDLELDMRLYFILLWRYLFSWSIGKWIEGEFNPMEVWGEFYWYVRCVLDCLMYLLTHPILAQVAVTVIGTQLLDPSRVRADEFFPWVGRQPDYSGLHFHQLSLRRAAIAYILWGILVQLGSIPSETCIACGESIERRGLLPNCCPQCGEGIMGVTLREVEADVNSIYCPECQTFAGDPVPVVIAKRGKQIYIRCPKCQWRSNGVKVQNLLKILKEEE